MVHPLPQYIHTEKRLSIRSLWIRIKPWFCPWDWGGDKLYWLISWQLDYTTCIYGLLISGLPFGGTCYMGKYPTKMLWFTANSAVNELNPFHGLFYSAFLMVSCPMDIRPSWQLAFPCEGRHCNVTCTRLNWVWDKHNSICQWMTQGRIQEWNGSVFCHESIDIYV